MQVKKISARWKTGVFCAAAIAALPLWYPLGLGLLLAAAARALTEKLPPKRARPAGVFLLCAAGLGLFLLANLLSQELSQLSDALPTLCDSIDVLLSRLQAALPAAEQTLSSVGALLQEGLRGLILGVCTVGAGLCGLFSADTVLVTVVFSVLLLPKSSSLGAWANARLLPAQRQRLALCCSAVRKGFTRLRGHLPRFSVVFALSTGAALLLGLPCAGLFGALAVLLEALPTVGAGWVLLPVAFSAAVLENTALCVGFAALYLLLIAVRLLFPAAARHRPHDPLWALVSAYLGWRALGMIGLLLTPVFAALCRPLLRRLRQKVAA